MIPRVVIAGTSSGAGKTSVTCGLIGALRERGVAVQGFKVGPDFIDPSYHALASGRPGRNLDAFLSGPELIAPLARHGARGAEIAVIEGVMGLFDGASGRGELASTAHVAKLLRAPVVLVVDASAMARSVAAIVHGYRTFDAEVNVAGVIFNRVGSDGHELLLREAIEQLGVPVLGALRRNAELATPERHLGLVPAGERVRQARGALASLAEAIRRHVDLDGVVALARGAPPLDGPSWSPHVDDGDAAPAEPGPPRSARIAIARGPAFSFHYEENLELLGAGGAELLDFDPLCDEDLPRDANALILAGGFPEVFADELHANAALRAAVARLAGAGKPVIAECGGLLFLCRELDGREMCGVLPAVGRMTERLSLGYREATVETATPWIDRGAQVRGHEFHYSQITAAGVTEDAPNGDTPGSAWILSARDQERREGFVAGGVQASYLHVHWAAHPDVARRFVRAAAHAADPVAAL